MKDPPRTPMRISDESFLYNPQPDREQLLRDLEMFRDPELFDQSDPLLHEYIRYALMMLGFGPPRLVDTDDQDTPESST